VQGGGGEMESGLIDSRTQSANPDAGADLLEVPWADRRTFFVDLAATTTIGCVMGALSYPYSLVTDKVHEWWLEKTGPPDLWEDVANMCFRGGSTQWVLVAWLCCTAVGVLKALMRLEKYPSFITECKRQHVDPWLSAKVLVGCIASLCAGGTLGLEAGLGTTGAAVGHLSAAALVRGFPGLEADAAAADLRRRTYILSGIAAGFGAILPSPFIAVLLIGEAATQGVEREHPASAGEFMTGRRLPKRVLVFLVPAATFSFVVRYAMDPTPLTTNLGAQRPYDNWSALYAIPLGFVAALVGLAFLIAQGLTKKLVEGLGSRIERVGGKAVRQVALASIAGVVTGLGIYLFPLAYSSGRSAMPLTIKHRANLSTETLVGTAVVKCLTFWVGMHCGLVGGLFFPLMYIGLVTGEVSSRAFGLDPVVCIPLMVGAVPASFVTAPVTMLALPVGMFVMGPLNAIPIFVATVTSNTLLVGTGLLGKMMARRSS